MIKDFAIEARSKNEEEPHESGFVWKIRSSPKNGLYLRWMPKVKTIKFKKNDKVINVENLVFSFLFYVDYSVKGIAKCQKCKKKCITKGEVRIAKPAMFKKTEIKRYFHVKCLL